MQHDTVETDCQLLKKTEVFLEKSGIPSVRVPGGVLVQALPTSPVATGLDVHYPKRFPKGTN